MNCFRDSHTDIAPLAWARAIAFGIVAGGMGVLEHDLVARTATQPWILLLGIAFATLVARPLAPLRIGAPTMLAGLAILQTVIHVACIAALDSAPQVDGGVLHAHAHMVMPGVDLSSGGWPMLLAHAASLLLGALVLLELEAFAWDGVARVARRVAAAALPCTRPRPERDGVGATIVLRRTQRDRLPGGRDVGRCHATRGPPQRLAFAP